MTTPRYLRHHTVNEVLTDLRAITIERSIAASLDDDTEADDWRAMREMIEQLREKWDATSKVAGSGLKPCCWLDFSQKGRRE